MFDGRVVLNDSSGGPKRSPDPDNKNSANIQRGEAPVVRPTEDVELTIYGVGEGAGGPMLIEAVYEYENGVESFYTYRIVDFNEVATTFIAKSEGPRNVHVEEAIEQIGGEVA